MAINAEVIEIKEQAQAILREYGAPLPGELQTLEAFGKMLRELHEAELTRPYTGSTLSHLYFYLLHPGITTEVLQHQPTHADPKEVFHLGLYNDVLDYARTLPLRGVEIPVGKGKIAIWSSQWEVEEQICTAAEAAVLGDLLPLPRLDSIDDCSINFSSRKNSFWRVYSDGHIMLKQGSRDPVAADQDLARVAKITFNATRFFSQMQPRGQDWF